jgi:excisionase family DNA binding protein
MPSNLGLDFKPNPSVNRDGGGELESVTLVTMKEAEARLKLSTWSLYQLINKNEIPTVRIGGRRFIRLLTLQSYLQRLEQQSKEGGNYG